MQEKFNSSSRDIYTQPSFFSSHWKLISAMIGTWALIGLGIGLPFGLLAGIPFYGFGAVLTGPLFAGIGLIFGGLVGLMLGVLGAVSQDWFNKPATEEKTHLLEKADEEPNLDLDTSPSNASSQLIIYSKDEPILKMTVDSTEHRLSLTSQQQVDKKENSLDVLQRYMFGNYVVRKKSKISIADFYAYVFEKKADIKQIAHVAHKKINVKVKQAISEKSVIQSKKMLSFEEIQQRKQDEKRTEMNNFKASLGDVLISNPNFRTMLRQTNAQSLETFLFGNSIDQLNNDLSPQYTFPTDNEIKSKFDKLNSIYHFYDKNTTYYANAIEQFVTLFKGCKLIADYVENNNDNDNSVPALHAYKILVLFNKIGASAHLPFAKFEEYLKTHQGYIQPNPIHDTLVTELPKNAEPVIHDLDGWQRLIHKHGLKAIQYFQRAAVVEQAIKNKAPSSLKQASDILMKSSYQRHDEYPQLAALCMQYSVSEETYNKCLEIKKNIKVRDNLPGKEFDIDGKSISPMCAGYYLAKLPIDDPHAYLLGHLTNCCQSVGRDSEMCVIDGITRENNGFYVLLKNKTKLDSEDYRLQDGSINYEKFEIVGQGYAWLSRHGNLTFDSWENLRAGEGITSCYLMKLPDHLKLSNRKGEMCFLHQQLLFSNKTEHALILFGKQLYFVDMKKREVSELPAGKDNQSLLFCLNQLKDYELLRADQDILSHIQNALNNSLDDAIAVKMLTKFGEVVTSASDHLRVTIGLGGQTPTEFKKRDIFCYPELIAEGSQYGDSSRQGLVFVNKEKQEKIFNTLIVESIKTHFLEVNYFASLICSDEIISMQQAEMIRDLISNKKYETLWHSILNSKNPLLFSKSQRILTWETLGVLHKSNDLNSTSFDLMDSLIQELNFSKSVIDKLPFYRYDLIQVIQILIENKLYNHKIYMFLLEDIRNTNSYLLVFKHLVSMNLLSHEYCKYVLQLKKYAVLIPMFRLSQKHITLLLNFEQQTLLDFSTAFFSFAKVNLLPTEEMLDVMMDNNQGKNVDIITSIFISLKKADVLNPEIVGILKEWLKNQNIYGFEKLQVCLKLLEQNKILTKDKFVVLIADLSSGSRIFLAIKDIGKCLNDKNWEIMLLKRPYVENMAYIFNYLKKSPHLLNADNCTSILTNAEFAFQLYEALRNISDSTQSLITNITLDRLLLKPENIVEISSALINLYNELPKTITNVSIQKNHPSFFISSENKLAVNAGQKLFDHLKGTTVELEYDEVNTILEQSYANDCKMLIEKGYPMPKALQEALHPSREVSLHNSI